MTHKPDYDRGRDDAFRWAVTWLHKRAKEMNDPHAVVILNSAAFSLGVDTNRPKISGRVEPEPFAPGQSDAIRAEVIAQGVDPNSDEADRMGRAMRQNMLRKTEEK